MDHMEIDEDYGALKRKREQADLGEDDLGGLELDAEAIEELLKNAPQVDGVDAASMKRLVLAFERACTKNQEMRIKYAKDAGKFMDSEVELNEEIKKLHAIAATPALYPDFIALKAHETILGLLMHENPDIICAVIDLLRELTDADVSESGEEEMKILINALLELQVFKLLMDSLKRLDEKEPDEQRGVYNVLNVFENVLEVEPSLAELLVDKTDALAWLLKRIQVKEFDEVKQYASELISILVQNSQPIQIKIGKLNGIDALLMAVSRYKKTDPQSKDEEEFLENLFDALCVVSVLNDNRKYFTQADGLKLLQIIIKNKGFGRSGALKLLDYVLLNDAKNCRRWIQLPALGTLFAAFMKNGSRKQKKGDEFTDDEHILSSIVSLYKELDEPDKELRELQQRVVDKFRENDMEKVERLLELYEKYRHRVAAADALIQKERDSFLLEGLEIDSEDEEQFLARRLEAGLFSLQLVCFLIAAMSKEDRLISAKAEQLLKVNDSSFAQVGEVLLDYADTIGSANSAEKAEQERHRLLLLASFLGLALPKQEDVDDGEEAAEAPKQEEQAEEMEQ